MATTEASHSWLITLFKPSLDTTLWFQLAWTLLRVMVGLLMIHNGVDKLADVEGFATHVVANAIGLPFPVFFTYCSAYVEIIGSIFLILGVLIRPATVGLLVTMGVAIYFHVKVDGFKIASFEMATLYGSCFLFFLVNGGGQFSVDAWIASHLGGITKG